jgi:hypothetical protein
LQKVDTAVIADSRRIRLAMATQEALVGLGDGFGDSSSREQRVGALAEIIRQKETMSGEALIIWMREFVERPDRSGLRAISINGRDDSVSGGENRDL